MDNWIEIRTASHVARLGTVSAAAALLGVHRSTVIRHIDALEATLGAKLFQRHPRGYTPTELGLDVLRVAEATEDQFGQLLGRAKGHSDQLTGDLIVTSVDVVAPSLLPILNTFAIQNPRLKIRFLSGDNLLKLEYGEAHVAFRVGARPEDPDNIVKPFATLHFGLYAAADYADRRGIPRNVQEFAKHDFIGSTSPNPRAPILVWLNENVAPDRMTFISNQYSVMSSAVLAGSGIGFLPETMAREHPDLIEVMAPIPAWDVPVWRVTHVDQHRTAKVQAFLEHLKTAR